MAAPPRGSRTVCLPTAAAPHVADPKPRHASGPRTTHGNAALRYLKRADVIVLEIKRWIVEQLLPPGERLPNEKALIEIFGASKGTIREALKSMEVQGLISINTGPKGGAVLREVPYERTAQLLQNFLYFKNVRVEHIYQVRKALEPELAATLVGIMDQEALAQLDELANAGDTKPKTVEENDRLRQANLQFHDVLADACPNPLLGFICKLINRQLRDLLSVVAVDQPTEEMACAHSAAHVRIVAALRKDNPTRVRRLMLEHMLTAENYATTMCLRITNRFLVEAPTVTAASRFDEERVRKALPTAAASGD